MEILRKDGRLGSAMGMLVTLEKSVADSRELLFEFRQ